MKNPYMQFAAWYALAQEHEPSNPNACALATVDLSGPTPRPDVRIVLLKAYDERGFTIFTNQESAKARQLAACPTATLDFHWKSLDRQVRLSGAVSIVDRAESEAYFATRARESQLSAWASIQSEPLENRAIFEAALEEMALKFPANVPCPPHWGGYRVDPEWIEFWEERPGRQHHRERFSRVGEGWSSVLLYP